MRFYKTNNVNDEGVEHPTTEVAKMFLASNDYREWRTHKGELLDRCVLRWAAETLGGTEDDTEPLLNEVCYWNQQRNTTARLVAKLT